MIRALPILVVALLLPACGGDAREGARPPLVRVAVAANFMDCAEELARRFRDERGVELVLVVGATGRLAHQIESGAPFEVFLAADEERPRALEESGRAAAGSRFTYARGRLVLAAAPGAALPSSLEALELRSGERLALARPETAPYGRAAMETLASLGLEVEPVRGESVAQVLHFLLAGAVRYAFLPLSLARSRGLPFLEIDARHHAPIEQQAVLVADASAAARDFLTWLADDEARGIIEAAGYEAPRP